MYIDRYLVTFKDTKIKRKRKREKNSKTDRGKLPDRTQIEATFSSHNLED